MSKQINRAAWKSRPVVLCAALGAVVGLVWVLVNSVHTLTTGDRDYQGVQMAAWAFGMVVAAVVAVLVGGLLGAVIGRGWTALQRRNGDRQGLPPGR